MSDGSDLESEEASNDTPQPVVQQEEQQQQQTGAFVKREIKTEPPPGRDAAYKLFAVVKAKVPAFFFSFDSRRAYLLLQFI